MIEIDTSNYTKHECKGIPGVKVTIYKPIRTEEEEKKHRKELEDALRQYGRYLASVGAL